jgi:hypothetical protein
LRYGELGGLDARSVSSRAPPVPPGGAGQSGTRALLQQFATVFVCELRAVVRAGQHNDPLPVDEV